MNEYLSAPWYVNKSRGEAEIALSGPSVAAGRFVVRPSSRPQCLSLTIKVTDTEFIHTLITCLPAGGFSATVAGVEYTKPSVTDLLISMGTKLLFPPTLAAPLTTKTAIATTTSGSPKKIKSVGVRGRGRRGRGTRGRRGRGGGRGRNNGRIGGTDNGDETKELDDALIEVEEETEISVEEEVEVAVPDGVIDYGVVLESYEAEDEGELSLIEGDKIYVFQKAENEWYMGASVSASDVRGWFPMDFVEYLGVASIERTKIVKTKQRQTVKKKVVASRQQSKPKVDDLGLSDIDVLNDILGGDFDLGDFDDLDLPPSSSSSSAQAPAASSAAESNRETLIRVYYAAEQYISVALRDSDSCKKIILQACKKFKVWNRNKVFVFSKINGQLKRLRRAEQLGATYGPMLASMRLELRNERGAFVSTTVAERPRAVSPRKQKSPRKQQKPIDSTELLDAAKHGDTQTVVALLLNGANANVTGVEAESPLLLAAYGGHLEVLRKLLTAGANVKYADTRGVTALHVASLNGHVEVVRALLVAGADRNARSQRGKRAIDVATNPQIAQLLNFA